MLPAKFAELAGFTAERNARSVESSRANFANFPCVLLYSRKCANELNAIAVIDTSRLRAEQERVFRKRHHEYTRIGVGVSKGAQAIFDMIDKTLPCDWDDNIIVVLKTVRLAPPYDVKSIRYVAASTVGSIETPVDTMGWN